MRGEYSLSFIFILLFKGSPPLARGVLRKMLKERKLSRITPACAGSTNFICHPVSPFRDHPRLRGEYRWYSRRQAVRQDHPRLRGEYRQSERQLSEMIGSPPLARGVQMVQPAASRETGSPPLARGVQTVGETTVRNDRITPACAGSTSDMWSIATSHRDHPRLRGEYSSRVTASITPPGSPPLARGVQELG